MLYNFMYTLLSPTYERVINKLTLKTLIMNKFKFKMILSNTIFSTKCLSFLLKPLSAIFYDLILHTMNVSQPSKNQLNILGT